MKPVSATRSATVLALLFSAGCTKKSREDAEEILGDLNHAGKRVAGQLTTASGQTSRRLGNAGKELAEKVFGEEFELRAENFSEFKKALPGEISRLTASKATSEPLLNAGVSRVAWGTIIAARDGIDFNFLNAQSNRGTQTARKKNGAKLKGGSLRQADIP